ncbi:alanine racemase [Nitratireductor arenosus]|uniref:alanine racemase n=1 Tax=Nitratireductor arenosus TaxID=2682096 RepID=UPI003CCCA406
MSGTISIQETGVEARLAGAFATIDLRALQQNYRALAARAAPARTACVVKADAYGLGIAKAVPALAAAGCDTFFVAWPEEGRAVREAAPDARIFVLGGLFGREAAEAYAEAKLIPVLNSRGEAAIWEGFCSTDGVARPCAIHVDTGMNRLGLTLDQARTLAEENALTGALDPVLVMSHLACGDQPDHPLNQRQLTAFTQVRRLFGGIEASLANSAGIQLGADYHFDLVRPGVALFGGLSGPGLEPVVTVQARIVQIRHVRAGEAVSYGAAAVMQRDSRVAICAAGYADGLHRALSGSGVPLREITGGGHGFAAGRRVPVLGRVTMDMTMFDITDVEGGALTVGDRIEFFGPNIGIEEAATAAGTISYELLTGLGRRHHRTYIGPSGESGTSGDQR